MEAPPNFVCTCRCGSYVYSDTWLADARTAIVSFARFSHSRISFPSDEKPTGCCGITYMTYELTTRITRGSRHRATSRLNSYRRLASGRTMAFQNLHFRDKTKKTVDSAGEFIWFSNMSLRSVTRLIEPESRFWTPVAWIRDEWRLLTRLFSESFQRLCRGDISLRFYELL